MPFRTPTSPRKGRKKLSEIFPELASIYRSPSPKLIPLNTMNLVKSLRFKLRKTFPPRGSIRGKPLPASFTVKMDSAYDYFHASEDPDLVFEQAEGFRQEVENMMEKLSAVQEQKFDEYLTNLLTEIVFGSNVIEKAGSDYNVTLLLCRQVFCGGNVPDEIGERDAEYEKLRAALVNKDLPSDQNAVLRSRREIVQHCQALSHIVHEMVLKDKPLSEELVLNTHRILTYKVDSPDGQDWSEYSGKYRTVSVGAGLTSFTIHEQVPAEMKRLVSEFNSDLDEAARPEIMALDPYAFAAKYCHKFVNIHPFLDGNGRVCRLLLNAILLKYAGIAVPIGEKENDRSEYLSIAARGSETEQSMKENFDSEDGTDFLGSAWGGLASFTLQRASESLKNLVDLFEESPEEAQ